MRLKLKNRKTKTYPEVLTSGLYVSETCNTTIGCSDLPVCLLQSSRENLLLSADLLWFQSQLHLELIRLFVSFHINSTRTSTEFTVFPCRRHGCGRITEGVREFKENFMKTLKISKFVAAQQQHLLIEFLRLILCW